MHDSIQIRFDQFENHLIAIFIVNILSFLIWRDNYVYHLTSVTCACSACLQVRFWFIVSENTRVKFLRLRFAPKHHLNQLLILKTGTNLNCHNFTLVCLLTMNQNLTGGHAEQVHAKTSHDIYIFSTPYKEQQNVHDKNVNQMIITISLSESFVKLDQQLVRRQLIREGVITM